MPAHPAIDRTPMRDPVTRRRLLGLCLGTAAVAACSAPGTRRPAAPASSEPNSAGPPATSDSPEPAGPGGPAGPATEVVRSTSGRAQLALTFHGAGEVTLARRVLDLLVQHNAHVTVLAVGTWLQASPDAAKMVLG